jgi:hypothetical protein
VATEELDYSRYVNMQAPPQTAAVPLERDTIRRFIQAIMDDDPNYHDDAVAARSKFGGITAPPLYPVHAFRRPAGTPDPLDAIIADPDADGSASPDGGNFGLPPVVSPYKRLLNGGNEIEFFRCLRMGERAVVKARYADVTVKRGSTGNLLLVVVESTFSTEAGELLLINRQTLIWR